MEPAALLSLDSATRIGTSRPKRGAEVGMEELIARVAAAADIPANQAERAIGLIFAFLRREAPAEVDDMLREVPGATEAVERGEADKPQPGGMMGGLMNMLGNGGGLMGLASQLTGIGLGTSEMATVGKEIFGYAREKAGDERVGKVTAAVPGLSQFI